MPRVLKDYVRNCPSCNKEIKYRCETWYFNKCITKGTLCRSCRALTRRKVDTKGIKNPNYKGKMDRESYKRICSNCKSEIIYKSYEAYRKANRKNYGCGCLNKNTWQNYNRKACVIFEEINHNLNWNGIHAENLGEKQILSYFVDYYEPNLNIVIEYDENHHKYQKEKDKLRQYEITKHLDCKFYRIKHDEDWKQILREYIK